MNRLVIITNISILQICVPKGFAALERSDKAFRNKTLVGFYHVLVMFCYY